MFTQLYECCWTAGAREGSSAESGGWPEQRPRLSAQGAASGGADQARPRLWKSLTPRKTQVPGDRERESKITATTVIYFILNSLELTYKVTNRYFFVFLKEGGRPPLLYSAHLDGPRDWHCAKN